MSQLPEYLQFHGQSRSTGCLSITGLEDDARVYLLDGEVVYAESGPHRGLVALYRAMRWDNAGIAWEEGVTPSVIQTRQPVDALLFQYAQLEDTGQTDDAALIGMFGNIDAEEPTGDIRLMDLGRYEVSFEVLNTAFRGFVFYLEKPVSLVGRGEDCDIILPDASVSSHHCKVMLEKHCIRVVDLGSTNGTRINNEIIAERILQPGDAFQIGSVMISMHLKMRRHLDAQKVQQAQKQLSRVISPEAAHTQKIDPKALQKVPHKITGPITWKNLTGDVNAAKKDNGSLFSKMFGKK